MFGGTLDAVQGLTAWAPRMGVAGTIVTAAQVWPCVPLAPAVPSVMRLQVQRAMSGPKRLHVLFLPFVETAASEQVGLIPRTHLHVANTQMASKQECGKHAEVIPAVISRQQYSSNQPGRAVVSTTTAPAELTESKPAGTASEGLPPAHDAAAVRLLHAGSN